MLHDDLEDMEKPAQKNNEADGPQAPAEASHHLIYVDSRRVGGMQGATECVVEVPAKVVVKVHRGLGGKTHTKGGFRVGTGRDKGLAVAHTFWMM